MRAYRLLRWLFPIALVVCSGWLANLAVFNWWAAGGPPTVRPENFEHRGNLFFFAACVTFLAAVVFFWLNLRRSGLAAEQERGDAEE
jgi:hypothetical protein